MILKILTITLSIFFFTSCTSKLNTIKKIEPSNYNVISLDIYEFNFLINEEKLYLPEDLGFDSNFLIEDLYSWGNQKFKVNGETKSLLLTVKDFSLREKKVKKNYGLKKFFLSSEEIEYSLSLKINMNFFDNDKVLDSLGLNGSITFLIRDNNTINEKKKFLYKAYSELIKKVDESIDTELKKDLFSKFLSPK